MTTPLSSPFADILGTNHVPSAEECASINALILEPEQKLQNLNEQISRLQAERDELESFIEPHRRLLFPFRRFPVDIWREIFVRCLNEEIYISSLDRYTVLQLSSVCHSWREIALTTPRIWSRLEIIIPLTYSQTTPDQLRAAMQSSTEGAKLWLDRSGSLPTTLRLTMDRRRLHQLEPTDDPFARITIASIRLMRQMDSYNAILAESLKEIVLSSRRWKALKVPNHYGGSPATNWPSPDWQILLGVFADLTQDDLPIFDTLWTHNPLTNPDQPERLTPFASLLPKLSSLRTLAIIDEPMETRIIDPPALPWAFLTTLHLTYSPLMPTSHSNLDSLGLRIHRVAQLCPSLAVLRLAITLSNPPIVGAEEFNIGDRAIMPIEFSRLRSLSLSLDGYGEDLPCRVLYNVLQRMTTPAMENLEINFADRFLPYPYHAETTILPSIDLFSTTTSLLIRRSGCHITRLTIPSPLLTPEPVPLAQYLELLPDLNFLTMSHMHLPLLELLARELSLCPKLEGLKVSQMVEEPDAIIEFAAARRDTLKNLRGCFDEEGGLKVVANRNRFPLTEVVVLEPPFPLSASSL